MDSPQYMQARLALCQPQHTVLDLFTQTLLESIATLKGSPLEGAPPPRQGPAPRNAPAFRPASEYIQFLHQGASALESTGLTYAEAVEKLAFHSAHLIFAAPMGAMVLSVAGKDPNEGLSLTQGMAGATATFGEREYERVSDRSARLIFRDEFFGPAWARGFALAGLIKANPNLTFHAERESGEPPYASFTLLVKW